MRPCSGSQLQPKSWRVIFGCSTTNSGASRTSEVPGGSGNPTYTAKLQVLHGDFPQYIHDNTDDEILNSLVILDDQNLFHNCQQWAGMHKSCHKVLHISGQRQTTTIE